MRKIIIGFSKPKNKIFPIFSWLIRLFQGGTQYSHVYIRWYSPTIGTYLTYEASGTSVKFVGEQVYEDEITPIYEYEISISDNIYLNLLKFCIRYSGIKYGVIQVIGIAIALLFKLKKNPLSHGDQKQVCSEIVQRILKQILHKDIEIDLDLVTPKNIKDFLDTQKDFKRIL